MIYIFKRKTVYSFLAQTKENLNASCKCEWETRKHVALFYTVPL